MNWSQPCCERCWVDKVGRDDEGNLRKPHRLTDPTLEQCAWCGLATIFGVYVRHNPTKLPYPTLDDES